MCVQNYCFFCFCFSMSKPRATIFESQSSMLPLIGCQMCNVCGQMINVLQLDCQIAAPRWPNDISSAAGNAIYRNRAQNIECSFGCVARSAVLLKPNVASILLFNLCEQKFVQNGPITMAIDCNGFSLLIFKEKWPNYASGSKSA